MLSNQPADRTPRRVVIAGGGVAGVEALLALRQLAGRRVQIELVAPERDLVYRPLSVIEPFEQGRLRRYPLERIAADAGARLRRDALIEVDDRARVAYLASGVELSYDALLVAIGARAHAALPGALTFAGPFDAPGVREVIGDVAHGRISRIAFAVPAGVSWPFPIYELALSAATVTREPWAGEVEVTVVTPERSPLEMFGRAASDAVARLLDEHGVRVITERHPRRIAPGRLELAPGGEFVMVDRVVAAPRLSGPRMTGLPADADGFILVDDHGRVPRTEAVFAAGDGAAFPIKQGGLAAQQADAAAEGIAAEAGAPINPRPFRPVLRGLLFAVGEQRYLRASVTGGQGDHDSTISEDALWWPPTKIAARYLAPYLAAAHDIPAQAAAPDDSAVVPVELEAERGSVAGGELRRRAFLVAGQGGFRALDLGPYSAK